jgi:two-component system, cell cycle sensor histidine kinase and response regulator CckA
MHCSPLAGRAIQGRLFVTPTNGIRVDTPPGARGTILVVDDEPQVRALAARALAEDGFDVLQAPDAITALALLQDPLGARVALVVTDIVMPGLQGHELGRLLHHLMPTLPVLYMSGYARPDFNSEDVRHWLPKPFSLSDLVEMARALCDPAQSPQ